MVQVLLLHVHTTLLLEWFGVYTKTPELKSGLESSGGVLPIAGSNRSNRNDRWYDSVLTEYRIYIRVGSS